MEELPDVKSVVATFIERHHALNLFQRAISVALAVPMDRIYILLRLSISTKVLGVKAVFRVDVRTVIIRL